jgi:hypothetical protein
MADPAVKDRGSTTKAAEACSGIVSTENLSPTLRTGKNRDFVIVLEGFALLRVTGLAVKLVGIEELMTILTR